MSAKKLILACMACVLMGCGTISISETRSEVSTDQVKKKIGTAFYLMQYLDKTLFNYYMAQIHTSVNTLPSAERAVMMKKLDGWVWEENRYFKFEIRHIEAYEPKAGDFKFTMSDAKRANLVEDMVFTSGHFQDLVQYMGWMIKTKKTITLGTFSKDELPVVLTVDFFKTQKKEYTILPRK